jgi:hypothetical protein
MCLIVETHQFGSEYLRNLSKRAAKIIAGRLSSHLIIVQIGGEIICSKVNVSSATVMQGFVSTIKIEVIKVN